MFLQLISAFIFSQFVLLKIISCNRSDQIISCNENEAFPLKLVFSSNNFRFLISSENFSYLIFNFLSFVEAYVFKRLKNKGGNIDRT